MSTKKSNRKGVSFGGDWTEAKLEVLAGYLRSYTNALKAQKYKKAFIDAFAGTGYREAKNPGDRGGDLTGELLFPDLAQNEPQRLLDGSPRIALQTEPAFDKYIFFDSSPYRCEQLERLKSEFPDLVEKIEIRQGDANELIQQVCRRNWRMHRAVLFLDPFGMQVEWETIESIARTKAIDMWLLFPLGIGVNRLLTRTGEIPTTWRKRLNILLGTESWFEEFYKLETETTLFGDEERLVKKSMAVIGRYFNKRLKEVFAGVAEPGVLKNSANCPLYLLCFAVGNPHATKPALRIANHLLKELRQWL